MKTKKQEYKITNNCTCTGEDGEYTDDCYGCWNDVLADFNENTKHLLDIADGNFFIDGLPLWNYNVSGNFTVKNTEELLRAITIRGDWTLRYSVDNDTLYCRLSHHDVPTGRSFTVKPVYIPEWEMAQ